MLMIGVAFHIVAAVIWVGGMFFALVVLRPSTGPLDPPIRLALWERVFSRFFPWVWGAVVVLLVSGFAMVLWGFGGFAKVADLCESHDGARDHHDAHLCDISTSCRGSASARGGPRRLAGRRPKTSIRSGCWSPSIWSSA